MKSQVPLLGLLLFTVLIVAACAAPAAPVAPAPPAPPASPAPQATLMPPTQVPVAVQPTAALAAAPVAKVAMLSVAEDATLGQFLADEKGNALYLFTKDDKNMSNCYDTCATAWPPLLSDDQPKGMDGVDTALLGTTQRNDGSTQVTYSGYPLYYFAKDEKAGDTKGQGVNGVWYVMSPSGAMVKAAIVKVLDDAKLGKFLADDQGRVLYLYTKDDKNTSNCYDKCATAWPPLLSAGQPKGMDGINASLLGTTQRKDGSIQVTYNGYPLYYYVKDEKPGDVTGQGVGDVWYVISPEGEMVKGSVAAAPVTQSDKQDTDYYK